MSSLHKQRTLAVVVGAITFVSALCLGLPAQAAEHAASPVAKSSKADANQKTMEMEQRFMQLRSELAQTQQEALKKNPSLIKQEKDFRELLVATMKRQGNDPKPKVDELNSLRLKVEDKKTTKAQRESLIAKARAIQVDLIKAEEKAVQDPKVSAARKKLSENTLADMRKVNPKTDQMIAELKAIGKDLAKMQSAHGS